MLNPEIIRVLKKAICGKGWKSIRSITDIIALICTIGGTCLKDFTSTWITVIFAILFTVLLLTILMDFVQTLSKSFNKLEADNRELQQKINSLTENRDYLTFFSLLSIPYSAIHTILRNAKINESDLIRAMIHFCTQLKKSFEHINGKQATYSVSIKLATTSAHITDRTELKSISFTNAFRDAESENDSSRKDELYNNQLHTVEGNTAYRKVVESILSASNTCYYVNNDIKKDQSYLSTSKDCYENGVLPYSSELVIPIIPLKERNNSAYLIGMLCITSNKVNGFIMQDLEYRIMTSLADGLYNILSRWHQKMTSQRETN